MRRFVLSSLRILLTLGLFGCSSNMEEVASCGDKKVTLRVAWVVDSLGMYYTSKIIELYEGTSACQNRSGVCELDALLEKACPDVRGGQLPDVIQMDMAYLSEYGKKSQLEDLTPYVKDGTMNTEFIDEKTIKGGKIGDQLYGFPSV